MNIYVESVNDRWAGWCYAISTEYSDAYLYRAGSVKEAVDKFSKDRKVKVDKVMLMKNGKFEEV